MRMGMQTIYQLVLSATMFIVLLTGGILSPRIATAATYYVATNGTDANTGSQSQPFRTIAKGLRRLSSGDTLYIRQGTYNESINPTLGAIPNGGGSWATATIIAGYPGETVTIVPTGSNAITLGDGGGFSWMIFDNLILDAQGVFEGGPGGLYIAADTHHIRFNNCEIRNGNKNVHGGGSFNEFLNCRVHNAYWYGFYWSGNNSVFDNNEVYDNGGYSYHLYATGSTTITNNIIRNNRIHGNGFTSPGGGGAGNIIFSHGDNNQAYNNLVYGNIFGFQIDYGCTNCQVFNNTIYNNASSGVIVANSSNTSVQNNIIYQNGGQISDRGSGTKQWNNYTSDPQFENPSAGDFHLKSGSPAKTASDTGGEVGAYANGGGPSPGGRGTLPAPSNLKVILVAP